MVCTLSLIQTSGKTVYCGGGRGRAVLVGICERQLLCLVKLNSGDGDWFPSFSFSFFLVSCSFSHFFLGHECCVSQLTLTEAPVRRSLGRWSRFP